jgi:hypothetical protein
MTQPDTALDGNTKDSRAKNIRSRYWFFTLNNHTNEEIDTMTQRLERYVFQEEIGENGTPHLQGYAMFNNARSFSSMKKICERAHWERVRNKEKAEEYCQKDDTATGRYWSKGIFIKKSLKLWQPLPEWQNRICDILIEEPDSRKIHWVVDYIGNSGKSYLCKWIICNCPEAIVVDGKAADMKYIIGKREKEGKRTETILVDLARTEEGRISYKGIEQIKNGCFMSTKYECEMVVMETPRVIVFSN